MTDRSVTHDTFTVERTYDATPERVFAAFSDQASKLVWLTGGGEGVTHHELDFRVGGREVLRGRADTGPAYTVDATYRDIVQDERIVYTYDMHVDDVHISVSLTTVELHPVGGGTRLVLTEQGAYLDGHDSAESRSSGVGTQLDALGVTVESR
jgi:uncharacterized protein YndB with AHSA1/START domain